MNIDGYALVFGAGSGIGKACAIAYAAEGAAGVAIADINFDAASAAALESEKRSTNPAYKAIPLQVDICQETSIQATVQQTVKAFGRIDYAVNSAGIGVEHPAEISEASHAEFKRFMKVNVTGTMLVLKVVSDAMKKQGRRDTVNPLRAADRGSIVVMGSASSHVATPKLVQYTASKHAVLGLSRNAALDDAPYGIRVNCVCPSWVSGPMIDRAVADNADLGVMISTAPLLGRIAQPDEVSDAVLFLSSPRSSYITGASLMVDGGLTLRGVAT